jgi:hypothetical protein
MQATISVERAEPRDRNAGTKVEAPQLQSEEES